MRSPLSLLIAASLASSVYAQCDEPLAAAASFGAGNEPVALTAADFDGDGFTDIAVVDQDDDQVLVLFGDGQGSFTARRTFYTGDFPEDVAMGDLDEDGDLDLVTANGDTNDISVLLNNGDGTFAEEVRYDAGVNPASVVIYDVNTFGGDHHLDIIVGNEYGPDISVLLGYGDGTFAGAMSTECSEGSVGPFYIAVADLGGDGIPDIAAAAFDSDEVSLLVGLGDGTFNPYDTVPVGNGPIDVKIGSLDGVVGFDLVVSNNLGNSVSVLLNTDAKGNFAPDNVTTLEGYARGLALGDIDDDGYTDIAVAQEYTDGVSTLIGWGIGVFDPAVHHDAGLWPDDVALADFDDDGALDMAVANYAGPDGDSDLSILTGNGDGTFDDALSVASGDRPVSIEAPDVDSDGDNDLILTNQFKGTLSVLYADADGSFPQPTRKDTGLRPVSVTAADLDADGDMDLAVANMFSATVSVFVNEGDGEFADRVDYVVDGYPISIAAGDLDDDGAADLVVANLLDVAVLMNEGDATFESASHLPAGSSVTSVALGDLDDDGDLDLAVANEVFNDGEVRVLLANGDGTFAAATMYEVADGPIQVVITDVDDDGALDLVTADNADETVSILLGDGAGTFGPSASFDAGDEPRGVAAADLNGDGAIDLVVSNDKRTMSFLAGDGTGVFAAPVDHAVGDESGGLIVADLDGALGLDVAVANVETGDVSILLGQCETVETCTADFNDDGVTNILDFVAFQAAFVAGDLSADCNDDGLLNVLDFVCFQAEFEAGC